MTPRSKISVVVAFIVVVLVGGSIAAWAAIAPSSKSPGTDSAPIMTGRWAHARFESKVFSRPSPGAPIAGQLRFLTEDRFPEVYLILRKRVLNDGSWLKLGLPGRPNGQTGWVRQVAMGDIRTSHRVLEIDRAQFMAQLWENHRGGDRKLLWSAPVGIGSPGMETPSGRFWIREKLTDLEPGSVYGVLAIGTSAYSNLSEWPGGGVVGIHGTNEPWLIPGEISHGCVRVTNQKIRELDRQLPIGTPIEVR